MLKLKKLLVCSKNKVCNISTLNKTPFEAIADKINNVLEGFNNGKTITVFKGNRTIVVSNKVHNEATLMNNLNGATIVRICA